jgi:peptide/nickel transport system substrate-binding protein
VTTFGKTIAAGAVGTVLLSAAACSAGSTADGSGSNSSATLAFTAEPANLDFTTSDGTAIPQVLMDNVYEGLVRLNQQGEIVPALAKSWTVSEDRRTYEFTLQPDATFSNGSEFTAEDVKFSIERVQSKAWTISLKSYMDPVDRVEVVSPDKVRVVLERPSNSWLFNMTTRVGAMFDPEGVSALASRPVGTGPYELGRWKRGDSIVLRRRDDYWGETPELRTVTFKYFQDATSASNALLSEGADLIANYQALDALAQFEGDDRFEVSEGTTNGEVVLAMNNASGPLADIRLRKAVMYAVDRQALLEATSNGMGQLIGSMVPPTDPWYEDLSDAYPHDPQRARRLVDQVGSAPITLRLRVPNLPYAVAAAQVVKSDLSEVGIEAVIQPLEFPAAWLQQVFTNHSYDMSIIQHVEPRDIVTFADPAYYWGYDSPKVQRLVAEADSGTQGQQVADMKKVARTLTADAAADWLYLYPNVHVFASDLNGVPQNQVSESFDVTDLSWAS